MQNLLAKGSKWLAEQQRKHVATLVYYVRASSSISIPATLGRSQFDVTDANGFVSREETEDFIISVADLEIDDQLVEPQVNDRIIVGDLDNGDVFQVYNVPGGKAWGYIDAHHYQYRIHTKKVGRQPPQPA